MAAGVRRKNLQDACSYYDDGTLPEVARIGAVSIFLLGLIGSYKFMSVLRIEGFSVVAKMIDMDTSFDFTEETMIVIVCLSGLLTFTGCVGYVGINAENRRAACVYTALSFVLLLLTGLLFTLSFVVGATVGPAVMSEMEHYCNVSHHVIYSVQLGCPYNTRNMTPESAPCGEFCKAHLAKLNAMGGCMLLDVLCHRFTYRDEGFGDCLAGYEANGPLLTVVRTAHASRSAPTVKAEARCCRDACDSTISCLGYSYDGKEHVCKLISPELPYFESQSAPSIWPNEQAAEPKKPHAAEQRKLKKAESENEKRHVAALPCFHYPWLPPIVHERNASLGRWALPDMTECGESCVAAKERPVQDGSGGGYHLHRCLGHRPWRCGLRGAVRCDVLRRLLSVHTSSKEGAENAGPAHRPRPDAVPMPVYGGER